MWSHNYQPPPTCLWALGARYAVLASTHPLLSMLTFLQVWPEHRDPLPTPACSA